MKLTRQRSYRTSTGRDLTTLADSSNDKWYVAANWNTDEEGFRMELFNLDFVFVLELDRREAAFVAKELARKLEPDEIM